MPVIRLPDGSTRSFDAPVTVAQVALDIGAGLAKAALAGKVNGNIVEISYFSRLDYITLDTPVHSITSDNGKEFAQHAKISLVRGLLLCQSVCILGAWYQREHQ